MPKYGNFDFPHPGDCCCTNMDVLAGYDSGSSDENAKILGNSADNQVKNPKERLNYMSVLFLCG